MLVAALGPQLLKVAGSRGCGTITWCTGERTLADHIIPNITAAAEPPANRHPGSWLSLPVSVTTDVDGTRKLAEDVFVDLRRSARPTGRCSTARAPTARPTWPSSATRRTVRPSLRRLAGSGVTDFAAVVTAPSTEDRDRTWDLLADLHG